MRSIKSLRVQRLAGAIALVAGFALLGFMVTTEGEPGLLPLVLVVLAALGTFATHRRLRAHRR